jgi:MoaA/NifB/PqqE/SkfB family radical SAM enzyme
MRTFSPKLAAKALWQMRVKKRPFVLSHAINARCNLRCSFCEYWRHPGEDMSTPRILRLLDDARAFGIGVYNAWATEPLLRADLPRVLGYAKEKGMITSLVTNGVLLAKRAHELSDLDYLSVSLDGIKSHKQLRGIDSAEVVKGIEIARDAGHEILINCIISGKNQDELEELVNLARSLGVWISFEPLHEHSSIDSAVWDDLGRKDLAGYVKAIDRLIDLKREGAPIINSGTYLQMVKSRKTGFRCHASDIVLHVASDGTVENCRVCKEPLGNISEGLERVWNRSGERRRKAAKECGGCLFFGYVENSLLYDFVPEVMAHYEWM